MQRAGTLRPARARRPCSASALRQLRRRSAGRRRRSDDRASTTPTTARPIRVPANLASVPDAVPRDEPFHRFANRPYTVFGRTYVPVVNKEPTRERGIASWYGKKFHGQKTSSGEIYDMFAMTAAHKTLPIPSYARVTNVRNGKSVVVRVNDRGPVPRRPHHRPLVRRGRPHRHRRGRQRAGGRRAGLRGAGRPSRARRCAVVRLPGHSPRRRNAAGRPGVRRAVAAARRLLRRRQRRDLPRRGGSRPRLEPRAHAIAPRDGLHRVRLGPYRNRDEALAIADKVRGPLGYAPPSSTADEAACTSSSLYWPARARCPRRAGAPVTPPPIAAQAPSSSSTC